MKMKTKVLLVGASAVLVAAGAWIIFGGVFVKGPEARYITRTASWGDVAARVQETGIINPVNEVLVGSEVSGTVQSISVDYNSLVKKGQVLCVIDPTNYQSAVTSSQASLRLAQANLNNAKVGVNKAKANWDMAKLTLERDQTLLKQNLINQNQVDVDQTAAIIAEQDFLGAQATVESSTAQMEVVQAQLDQSLYSLTKTTIKSPIDGIVLARSISVGQTVAASLQTPTLFTLASNLTDMQVDTSVDEADAGNVRTGAQASITVTAYPNVSFPGVVTQVRVNPIVVQNVVTYDAVVQIHDNSGRLFPGMTAQITLEAGKKTHVLTVPLPALLFTPGVARSNQAGGPSGLVGGGSGFGGLGGGGRTGGFSAGVVQNQGAPGGALAGAPGSRVTLWVLKDDKPVAISAVLGISDGRTLEISGGDLAEGDLVIVGQRRVGAPTIKRESSNGR